MGGEGAREDGGLSRKEITLGILVVIALLLWIFGGDIM